MEQRPSWKANSRSADQENPGLSLNLKVHCSVQKNSQSPRPCVTIRNMLNFCSELLAPSSNPQAEGPHLISRPLQFYSIYSQLRSTSGIILHSQPEDAPCRGDNTHTLHGYQNLTSDPRHKYLEPAQDKVAFLTIFHEKTIINLIKISWVISIMKHVDRHPHYALVSCNLCKGTHYTFNTSSRNTYRKL